MTDDLLDAGMGAAAGANLISPVVAGIRDLASGGWVRFYVTIPGGWSANYCAQVVRNAGIAAWDVYPVAGESTFHVRTDDADDAGAALDRAGLVWEWAG